ncbi:hypothetical protein D7V91_17470 [bacterium 1xD42-67]|nr:hypothetical protein D7V91_17470 [bacterium 1xD42-67]
MRYEQVIGERSVFVDVLNQYLDISFDVSLLFGPSDDIFDFFFFDSIHFYPPFIVMFWLL